ncbi:MAG: TetR family transcriptional regulator [Acidimicrobiia bacterium]
MIESLTDRRKRLLRDEIARVAIDLFVSSGFDAVTVDDIAAAAGTSQRTFFRYFATKDDIILDLARRLDRRLLDALDARPDSEGAVTALRNAYRATSHVDPADRDRVLQLAAVMAQAPTLRARAHGEHLNEREQVVERLALRMGVAPTDPRVRVLATAMGAVATVEFYRWADSGGRGNPSDAITRALEMLESGLAGLDQLGANQSA